MNYLLTSSGIENERLRHALDAMVTGQLSTMRAVFITTAANGEVGDKAWLHEDIEHVRALTFGHFECIDIAEPIVTWQEKLDRANIIFVGGGNTFYLMDMLRRTSVMDMLRKNDHATYVGISAGSIVCGQTIRFAADSNDIGLVDLEGFNLIDGVIVPHWNDRKRRSLEMLPEFRRVKKYTLADGQAIQIIGETIRKIE